jgi:putative ABC transport system permease protein
VRWLKQVVEITLMNLGNILQRLGVSLVVVIGIAGVVGVLVSVLSMAQGFRHTLVSTGHEDRVLLLRLGSDAEASSSVAREEAPLLAGLAGIARDSVGEPLASTELVVIVELPRKGETDPNYVPLRGVQSAAFAVRDEFKLIEGRRFEPGLREVIVGKKAAREFAGLTVGSKLSLRETDWTVVGIFETRGDVHESEIWSDAEVAMATFRRNGFQSVTAKLSDFSDAGLEAFKSKVKSDPRLAVHVQRESEYYSKQSQDLVILINVLGYAVAAFMAIGAIFGALNCMYSAIASRQVEIAILRALGFGALPVVVSVLVEALFLSLVGGVVGGALAYAYCNGTTLSTMNFNTFSQVAFDFQVTPKLLVQGLGWALLIGLVGGLFPTIRAARRSITAGLRAL